MNKCCKISNRSHWLSEIAFIRPVLVVLLVAYHSFAPYSGAWRSPDGIDSVSVYGIGDKFAFAFMLEGFFFISGYIFTFQLLERNKFNCLLDLARNKIERLLIPCFVLGIIYFICFKKYNSFPSFIYQISVGTGHLWYLPCLFWCFLIQYIIILHKWDWKIIMPTLFLCSLTISRVSLPLNMNIPLYYMLFFSGGGVFYINKIRISTKSTLKGSCIYWLSFLLLFIIEMYINQLLLDTQLSSYSMLDHNLKKTIILFIKIIVAWMGIIAIYHTAILYTTTHEPSSVIITIGACGYGTYLVHQFILIALYYHTDLPILAGTTYLPWLGFLLTFVLSLSVTLALRTTSFGRKYL